LYFVIYGLSTFSGNEKVENEPATISQVVSDPGREVYPSISPDNKYLVYSWRRIGQRPNLYIKAMDGLELPPKALTFSEFYEGRVVWHPNSEDIYYQRKHWNYDQCEVVHQNIITMEPKVIATCTGEVDFSLTISPNGKYLAFIMESEDTKKPTVQLLDLENNAELSVLYQCGESCLYEDLDVEFSPDGNQLVISRTLDEGFNEDVFLFDIMKGQLEQLTDTEGDIKGLAWHPSGDRIVYSSNIAGKRDGYVISLKDKTTQKLNIPGFSYPRFIPNSKDVIFHNWQVLSSLATLSVDRDMATTPFPLMHSEFSYHSPHYSERKNKLVFVSNESGFEEIWLSNVDGSERMQLTNLSSHLKFPRWSHDGEYIAFLGPKTAGKKNSLYVLNVQTQIVSKMPSNFEQHFRPSWSIDDKAIIAAAKTDNKTSLYRFPIDHSQPEVLLNQKVKYAEQDANGLIWFTPGRNKGLWRFDPSKEVPEPVQILDKENFRVSYKWEITSDGVYFQHDYANSHQIHYYNYETSSIKPIVQLPMGTIRRIASITYIPSEKKVVFTQLEFPKVDIKRLSHPLLN